MFKITSQVKDFLFFSFWISCLWTFTEGNFPFYSDGTFPLLANLLILHTTSSVKDLRFPPYSKFLVYYLSHFTTTLRFLLFLTLSWWPVNNCSSSTTGLTSKLPPSRPETPQLLTPLPPVLKRESSLIPCSFLFPLYPLNSFIAQIPYRIHLTPTKVIPTFISSFPFVSWSVSSVYCLLSSPYWRSRSRVLSPFHNNVVRMVGCPIVTEEPLFPLSLFLSTFIGL